MIPVTHIPNTNYGINAAVQALFSGGAQGVWYDPSSVLLDWRYNLLTYTEQFDNAAWEKVRSTVTQNSSTAPNGTLTADKLISTATTGAHYLRFAGALSLQSMTLSVYAKKGEYNFLYLLLGEATTGTAYFNLDAGIVGSVTSGFTSDIMDEGNGWYRCSITGISASTTNLCQIGSTLVANTLTYTGDGTSGIYIWGASLTTAENATKPYQQIVTPAISYLNYQAQPLLFQDSAGTTPVTAVEQPVGLMLDKSKGLVLGPELVVNGWTNLAWNEFSTSGGSFTATKNVAGGNGMCISSNTFSVVAGVFYEVTLNITSNTLFQVGVNFTSGTNSRGVQANIGSTPTGVKKVFIQATISGSWTVAVLSSNLGTITIDNISVRELPGNHAFQSTSASRPVLSARVNKLLATATLATQNVTTRATAHTLRFEGAGMVTLTGTAIGVYTAGTHSITTTAGTLTLTVVGSVTSADLRETNDGVGLPVYQAVVTSTNYATTGYPVFLRFDGVDDSMSTNSISFTSTDKMSVFAGVRKLSDAAVGILVELSASITANNGAFSVPAPTAANDRYGFNSKGTVLSSSFALGYAAPITNVVTSLGDISGDLATLLVNGTQVAQSTSDQGTGNYGNYPLFIGRRNNTSSPFNGQLYSMIIVGKQVTATELSSTETYTAIKTGVTLA